MQIFSSFNHLSRFYCSRLNTRIYLHYLGYVVFDKIEEKLKGNEEVTKQDLVALTFEPIMGGKLTKFDRIIKSIRLVKKINNEYRYDIESMLYAFADKFLLNYYRYSYVSPPFLERGK